uniref:Putative ribonuclease H-like domain-containing protein n=1 Tax=Tanacetum cinerariifolium TaxID=118510 RepID=A0A699GXA4_TANCI|nr:putative ribonuclease H-like domain-containing protein [Tanacetum cinerariifolium]
MTKDEAGNEIEVPPITAQQILARTRERKAKNTLLMAIPDEHLARFHGIKDAKTLWAAIKTRFGEGLDKGYDRFQRLLILLEIHRAGIDNLDIDDLYNNLKVYEADIKGSSRSLNSQNVAFISAECTSSNNELNAAYSVSTATCHSSQAHEKIDQDDLEEMDLKWQVECYNYHKRGNFAKEYRSARNSVNRSRVAGNARYRGRDNEEEATEFALMDFTSNPSSSPSSISKKNLTKLFDSQISAKVKTGLGYDNQFHEKEVLDIRDKEVTETFFDNRSSDEENNLANDRFKKGEGYHAVPPPLTRNYMPPKPDLSFAELDDSIHKPEPIPTKIDFVKADEFVKHVKPVDSVTHVNPVKSVKSAEQTEKSKHFSSSPKIDRNDWNGKMTQKLGLGFGFTKKACFVYGSMSHLIKDCTFHEDKMAKKSVLPTNVGKGTIFTRSGRIPVCAAKPKAAASTNAAKAVNTGHPQQALKNKGIVDSGCFRHLIGNKAYLTDYQDINDGGFVAFGSSRGKISSKVTDDFSTFSWVFLLASKDETSKVLKPFITAIENQISKKVKVIRCDNGTEFKNRDLDEFYGMKGIKREYRNARTSQQNGVVERKNMTLIEAARTMLADSLLPITFWAEAVNTACYVLNRALVLLDNHLLIWMHSFMLTPYYMLIKMILKYLI